MKILFINNGLTHYYNLVLAKLNNEPDVEMVVVVPKLNSAFIGAGVHQTKEGIDFKIIELEEHRNLFLFPALKGLSSTIIRERPDVVVVADIYVRGFLVNIPLRLAMKKIRAGLVMKSIPFRVVPYDKALRKITENKTGFSRFPSAVNRLLLITGLTKLIKGAFLTLHKRELNLPDAHVNYVESSEYWASYGVSDEKIFITGNSPDTDLLFSIRKSLEATPPILPSNQYRLLHVGRLVEWKRVDMLLRAFTKVRTRFSDAELLIIGNGPDEEALKKLANDLGLEKSVVFVGGIYDPKVLGQYFMASSLYVLAGMGGLSINDAMCFGLPVLCSVCDGTEKILVRDGVNGKYFRDGDEKDLVNNISWFLERPEQLRQMGQESVNIIKNEVNIHTVISGYMNAFKYVLEKKSTN